MSEASFKTEIGQKLLIQTYQQWQDAWLSQQLMLMNEYRLHPLNDEHRKFIDTEMIKLLDIK